jgi:endonuclease III
MKDGTRYASQVKSVFSKLRQKAGKADTPEPEEPLHRLAVAILAADTTDEQARRAVSRLLGAMESWNELRVSTPVELQRVLGNMVPNSLARCEQLVNALQSVFDRENRMSLDRLRSLGRREARQFLENLDGVDEYVAASVMLWSLGGHAIPVNNKLFDSLRAADLIHPAADRSEVQAFLERNISASQAREFCIVMSGFDGRGPTGPKRTRTTARSPRARTAKR